jgi:hypothetical protein
MSEIEKILDAMNKMPYDVRKRVGTRLGTRSVNARDITNADLLRGIRFLLSDTAIEMGIDYDAEKLDEEIFKWEV